MVSLGSRDLQRIEADVQPESTLESNERPAKSSGFGFRWWICALLFFATTINYVDRQVIGILKPTLQTELHWTEIDYSNIVFAFQAAYAVGLLMVGALTSYTLLVLNGVNYMVALIVVIALMAVMGVVVERIAIRPLRQLLSVGWILSTVGVSVILRQFAEIYWGREQKRVPSLFGDTPIIIGNVGIFPQEIFVVLASLLTMAALLAMSSAAHADDKATVDWAKGVVTARGIGIADRHAPSPAAAREPARRAAEDQARKKLAAALADLPLASGGTLGRTKATGQGLVFCILEWAKERAFNLEGATMGVQGFGNVGSNTAVILSKLGVSTVAVGDHTGYMYNPEGFNAHKLQDYVEAHSSIAVWCRSGAGVFLKYAFSFSMPAFALSVFA